MMINARSDLKRTRRVIIPLILLSGVVLCCGAASANDDAVLSPLVIETDMGIDDAMALALALQHPDLNISAVLVTEGVAAPKEAAEQLGRLIYFFNRSDVARFAANKAVPGRPAPSFRVKAQNILNAVLGGPAVPTGYSYSPNAYAPAGRKTTVAALGPLTQLAGAVTTHPELKERIARIVIPGEPNPEKNWNLQSDTQALKTLRASGIPLIFVAPAGRALKPPAWLEKGLEGSQKTSLGESFFEALLAVPGAGEHYVQGLSEFHDELAILYLVRPDLFEARDEGVMIPRDREGVVRGLVQILSNGRQLKDRVVFTDAPFPPSVFREDIRPRVEKMRINNGDDEWFAMLLMNELHDHLGAYSIIGVKMGLRAAELLNAPPHSMHIVSSTPAEQPISCLNDGLIVSTGSTPGRGLFRHVPGPPGTVRAAFTYNGRQLVLALKTGYIHRVGSAIGSLVAQHGLEDPAYWEGVRTLGLDIWENWHRRELFEIVETSDVPSAGQPKAP